MSGQRVILIVDDDKHIRATLRELLEDVGWRVLDAEDGQQALAVLGAQLEMPRVILLDIAMPIMDGFAFRAAQLADPAIASVPVIVMTADGGVEDKRRRIGCTHALRKPMQLDHLLDVLAAYC